MEVNTSAFDVAKDMFMREVQAHIETVKIKNRYQYALEDIRREFHGKPQADAARAWFIAQTALEVKDK